MACKGCGNLTPVRITRPATGSGPVIKRSRPLRPRRKQGNVVTPKPANDIDKR